MNSRELLTNSPFWEREQKNEKCCGLLKGTRVCLHIPQKKNNILPSGPHRTVLLHAFDGVSGFSPRFKVFPEKENYCTTFLPNFHELEINVFNCWLDISTKFLLVISWMKFYYLMAQYKK